MSEEFTCALCGETFQQAWSHEDAKAEFAEAFPDDQDEATEILCDDCYKEALDYVEAHK